MTTDPIWLPAAALVGVTALVWVKLYADRIGEMRAKRIDAQALATARDAAGRLEKTGAADNFRNLFEAPVLFYLLCVATSPGVEPPVSAIATARDAAGRLEKTGAADNFRNLFEAPVLFYLLCVAIALTGGSTPGLVAGAWAYVALRALHSLIHVTYNRVMHRFLVYVSSMLLLFGLWIAILPRLLA